MGKARKYIFFPYKIYWNLCTVIANPSHFYYRTAEGSTSLSQNETCTTAVSGVCDVSGPQAPYFTTSMSRVGEINEG